MTTTPVTRRYFIATGPRAEKVASEGLALVNARRQARREALKDLGADDFWEFKHRDPMALVFHSETEEIKPGFLKAQPHRDKDFKKFHVYYPDKRTKVGKAALEKMKNMALFDFSSYVCGEFKVNHSTIGFSTESKTNMALFHTVAGYIKDTLVFSIPFGGDQGGGQTIDISIPDDFREITKSQWIAFTEEGQPLDKIAA